MNERIQELKEQAMEWVPNQVNPDTKIRLLNAEKFAELIIRECILTIQMGITRDGPNTEKYMRSMKHIKQIREHFGVEE
jgi:hypothetical protein